MKVYFNFAVSFGERYFKDIAKAGRSSEQLLHIHAAKIATCLRFHKLYLKKCSAMLLELKRKLPDNKLTQARIRDMRSDETLVARCETAAECKTAERVAYLAKRDYERPDGFAYSIKTSYVDMSVTVTVVN